MAIDATEYTRRAFAPPTTKQKEQAARAKAKGGLTSRGIREFEQRAKRLSKGSGISQKEAEQALLESAVQKATGMTREQRLKAKYQEYIRSGRRVFDGTPKEMDEAASLVSEGGSRRTGQVVRFKSTDRAGTVLRRLRDVAGKEDKIILDSVTPAKKETSLIDKITPSPKSQIVSMKKITDSPPDDIQAEITKKVIKKNELKPTITRVPMPTSVEIDKNNVQAAITKSIIEYTGKGAEVKREKKPNLLRELKNKFETKAIKGDLGEGWQQYFGLTQSAKSFDEKGNTIIIKSGTGKAIELATKLFGNAALGFGTAKGIKLGGKVLVKLSKVGKTGAKVASVTRTTAKTTGRLIGLTYIAGLPFRAYQTGGDPQKVLMEFAGDAAFIKGMSLGGLKFSDIKKEKLTTKESKKIIKDKFNDKKPSNKKFMNEFKKAKTNKEKVKLVKAYKKEFNELPNLEIKFTKPNPKTLEIRPTGSKKYLPTAGQKIKKRGSRVKRKAIKSVKKKSKIEKKQFRKEKRKQFDIEVKKKKAELNKQKLDIQNNERKLDRLQKQLKLNKQKKAIRKDYVMIGGKKRWQLPIPVGGKAYGTRKEWLEQTKKLAKISTDFDKLYNNYKIANNMVRLYNVLTKKPNSKKLKELQDFRDLQYLLMNKHLNLVSKINNAKLKNWALIKYKKFELMKIKKFIDGNIFLKSGKKIAASTQKIPKGAKILFEMIKEPKGDDAGGRIVITDDGKTYIYRNVITEQKSASGQVLLQKQEVLLEVKQVPKQQQKQVQIQKQLQETKTTTKQKTKQIYKQEQFIVTEQVQEQLPKQRLKQLLRLEQAQLTKQDVKQIQLLQLDQKQEQKQIQKILQEQEQIQEQKQVQEQAQIQKQVQKLKTQQKLKQLLKTQQKLKTKQKLKQLLKTKQKLKTKTITEKVPETKPPKLFIYIPKKKKKKGFEKGQLTLLDDYFRLTPTLRGKLYDIKAKKIKGMFTGLETRGVSNSVIPLSRTGDILKSKKPLIVVAKNGKTIQGQLARVREYQRRIPKSNKGKLIPENVKILKKYKMLARRIK
jgi:hypothetical protein